jgi:hypothetical protein
MFKVVRALYFPAAPIIIRLQKSFFFNVLLEDSPMRSLIQSSPILLVVLLLLGAGLVLYSQAGDRLVQIPADSLSDMTDVGLPVGIPAPEIEGRDIDGGWFKLSDYWGKVVVLDCWVDQ